MAGCRLHRNITARFSMITSSVRVTPGPNPTAPMLVLVPWFACMYGIYLARLNTAFSLLLLNSAPAQNPQINQAWRRYEDTERCFEGWKTPIANVSCNGISVSSTQKFTDFVQSGNNRPGLILLATHHESAPKIHPEGTTLSWLL